METSFLSSFFIGVLVTLGLVDSWTTYKILIKGGRETNKLLDGVRKYIVLLPFGGPWLWLALAKVGSFVALGVGWYYNAWDGIGIYFLGTLSMWYAVVVVSNWKEHTR